MGYKIRDDAPTGFLLPAPNSGEDTPSGTYVTYLPGEPILSITSDVVERFEAGDESITKFIEEADFQTAEVDLPEAPVDPVVEATEPEPVADEPVVTQVESQSAVVGDGDDDELGVEPGNPFAV